MTDQLQLGVSALHPCSYLPENSERLVFTLPEEPLSAAHYHWLAGHNFRRSGNQLYRPYCPECQACQAVRLLSAAFKLSSSQRKLRQKALRQQWHWRWQQQPIASDYFDLFQNYIAARHADGIMYPAEPDHLVSLLSCDWLKITVLEQYIAQQMVGVLILDHLPDGVSAVYSFFEPDCTLSLGTLAVLAGIELCQQQQMNYFYLGYWVEHSNKMAYKANFRPQQRLSAGIWHSFE